MNAGAVEMKAILAALAGGRTLTTGEAEAAFDLMMSGDATPSQMGAFLMALRMRGETVAEITAAATVMRAKAVKIDSPPGAVDTCGTGGDASGTLNISTAVALVVAGCGVPVAKHGNRALSSRTGAADVLGALGVDLDAGPERVREALWTANIGFLMAPRYHSAMRNVAGTRVELGVRTIFNLLGPLANPAGARRQLLGVFAREWVEPMARVLGNLGAERAWVVHGSDGLDELTTTGPSFVAAYAEGRVRTFEVTPDDAGLPRAVPAALKGGDPQTNAAALRALLDGAPGPYRDIVLLNAAAALVVGGRTEDLREGARIAAQAIDTGHARTALDRLVAITNRKPADLPA